MTSSFPYQLHYLISFFSHSKHKHLSICCPTKGVLEIIPQDINCFDLFKIEIPSLKKEHLQANDPQIA